MVIQPATVLHRIAVDILTAVGTERDAAGTVADSLVDANLCGHDSHGIMRLPIYVQLAEEGDVDPRAIAVLSRSVGAAAIVDGNWGWGQPAMRLAVLSALECADRTGVGVASVRTCYHVGRLAPYVEEIARHRKIGLAFSSAGPFVAPFGSRQRVLGTNPIAWAVPRSDHAPPICLDIATAAIAEGKIRHARAKGVDVPPGAIVDRDGQPTTHPDDFYQGGALLPFGGHKGSGFGVLAQLLGAGLSGATSERFATRRGGNGPVVMAIAIDAFCRVDDFFAIVDHEASAISAATPAAGVDRVLLPGEPELRTRAQREVEGIPIPERTWDEVVAMAQRYRVALD